MTFYTKKKNSIFYTLAVLFFFNIVAYSQSQSDSLEFFSLKTPLNILSLNFNKQLSTYSLNGKLSISELFNNTLIKLNENYNSSFIKSANSSVRDEHNFDLSSAYNFSDAYSLGLMVNNRILSDSRRIEINQASESSVILYNTSEPYHKVYVSPFFGYTNNRQIGVNNYGAVYGIEGLVDSLPFSGFNLISNLKYKNEDIMPRRDWGRLVDVSFVSNSSYLISNILNLYFEQNRNDFYYKADPFTAKFFNITNNIQSRVETIYNLRDNLHYGNFLNIFSLDASGNVFLREVDNNTRYRSANLIKMIGYDPKSIFDTRIDELRIEFQSGLNYSSDIFNGGLRFNYSERDEKHITKNYPDIPDIYYEQRMEIENQNNNNATRLSAIFTGNFLFSKRDRFSFSFYQNKLKYDTPSNQNFDDRDEELSIIKLKYNRLLTPFFSAYVSAEGTIDHLVYIYSQMSSNNNINRILKLSSGGTYMGKNVYSSNYFDVSANYTVYDFEDVNPNIKSYSFRQYTATDSTIIKINNVLGFKHYGYIKLSEQGDLQWASFSTTPNRYLQEIYTEPELTYKYYVLKTGLGIRFYSIKTYSYQGKRRILQSTYNSIGPSADLYVSLSNLDIRIYGWYEYIKIDKNPLKQQASLFFQMNWKF